MEGTDMVRVKRYGFYGGYNSYFGNSPHSVSFKTPFFKIKVKNGFPAGGYGYQPYHIHDPFGGIGYYHPQPYGLNGGFTYPHDSYHYNLHEYGWIG
uniref:Uncharacterized protein n=1 Tax=Setaria digitata TaxID=48799 RepID=A0A915PRP8_9BILA